MKARCADASHVPTEEGDHLGFVWLNDEEAREGEDHGDEADDRRDEVPENLVLGEDDDPSDGEGKREDDEAEEGKTTQAKGGFFLDRLHTWSLRMEGRGGIEVISP